MKENIAECAWNECELTEVEEMNTFRIDPAVFEPKLDGEFVFDENLSNCELWEKIKSMNNITFMSNPLDGYLRCTAYVTRDEGADAISFRSYSDMIKIAPSDEDCSFESYKYFLDEFENNVCEIEFIGGLENFS